MKETALLKRAVAWAQKKRFKKIKANIEEFETPTTYIQQSEDREIVPDVTGVKRGRKSYIEIALKSDNIREKVSKWKLLSTLARMKGGKLFLLAPRGHKAFTQRIVKKYNLKAKIVYLKKEKQAAMATA